MGKQKGPTKGVTPPKGRPTRGRNEVDVDRRVFGPVAQWIAVIVALIALFVVIVIVTGGGIFGTGGGGGGGHGMGPETPMVAVQAFR